MLKILCANEWLTVAHDIDQHTIQELQGTLRQEKKQHQHRKCLNLKGEEDNGAQFFGSEEVKAALDYQASKQQEEEQRKQGIIDRKVLAAARKVQKEKERVEQAAITTEKRKAAAEARAIKEEEKRAHMEARVEALLQKDVQVRLQAKSTVSKEAWKTPKKQARRSILVVIEEKEEVVVQATLRGRQVQRPRRFCI